MGYEKHRLNCIIRKSILCFWYGWNRLFKLFSEVL